MGTGNWWDAVGLVVGSWEERYKKISVIVPCYNSEKYIEKCFDSLRKQTLGLEELQVIFVDDASTDNTLEYLQRYAAIYPQSVEVINLEKNHRQGGGEEPGTCPRGRRVCPVSGLR